MPKLPAFRDVDLIRILERCGFVFKRQRGSHAVYKHSDGRRVANFKNKKPVASSNWFF